MFLYYQKLEADCNEEFIGEYDTIESLMEKIKQQCDDGHEECPNDIPTFNEYCRGDFSNYDSDNDYELYIPSNKEVNDLNSDGYINIIKDYIDGEEETFFVTKNKIN